MRRTLVALLCIALWTNLAAVPTSARPKKTTRVVEIEYVASGGFKVLDTELGTLCPINFYRPQEVCIAAPVEPGERYVSVNITDLSGQKVAGELSQDINGDPFKQFGEFCGESRRPAKLPFPHVAYVQLWYYQGTCSDGTPSVMTAGTITFTFSNLP